MKKMYAMIALCGATLAAVVAAANGQLNEDAKLLASDGAVNDFFGTSVSISGDTAVIGASGDDDNGNSSGSAYIYRFDGASWVHEAKLLAADAAADDRFGASVSISGDTAVVGAFGNASFGSAYIFEKVGGVWTQQAKLLASDGAADDWFGWSVSISGETAVIGALLDDDNANSSGSVYVFERVGGVWAEQAKLLAADGAGGDWFGHSVSISGEMAVIGAALDDDNGNSSGSAFIFEKVGGVWTQQTKLLASDGAANDRFGDCVSISGETAVVGAFGNASSGSAFVFEKVGGVWAEQAKLLADDGAADDRFGDCVSISGDTAVIGAWRDDDNGTDSGSAFIFEKVGGVWTQQTKLLASDGAANDRFGESVSISGDTAVIGALGDNDNGAASGSAYVFGVPTPAPSLIGDDYIADVLVNGGVFLSNNDTALLGPDAIGNWFAQVGYDVEADTITVSSLGDGVSWLEGLAFDFLDLDFLPAGSQIVGAIVTNAAGAGWDQIDNSHVSFTANSVTIDASEIGGAAVALDQTVTVQLISGPVATCPGDIADDFGTIGADGIVSFGDFLALLGLVGPCPGGTPGCTGDIADDFGTLGADGMVSFGDFLALLGLVGPCP